MIEQNLELTRRSQEKTIEAQNVSLKNSKSIGLIKKITSFSYHF